MQTTNSEEYYQRDRYYVCSCKELFKNVESRNIVDFIKDTNFYHCM